MVEYTVLDYEGEPVTIEDGEILEAEPPESDEGEYYWDSQECDWEFEPYDRNGNDARDYGMGWYDCNTDWRSW